MPSQRFGLTILVAGLLAVLATPIVSGQADARSPHWSEREGWRFVTGGTLTGLPVVGPDGTLYAASADRYLYALSPEGRMRWRYDLVTRPVGWQVVSSTGSIHVGRRWGRILTLSSDGRRQWEFQADTDELMAPVSLPHGQLVVAEQMGRLTLLSPRGVVLWKLSFGTIFSADPVLDANGLLWVAMVDGTLAVIDSGGRVRSRLRVNEEVVALCPAADGMIIGTSRGVIAHVRPDGSGVWRTNVGSAVRTIVSGVDGMLYALLDIGSAVCVGADGLQRWRAGSEALRVTNAVAGDGVVFTLSDGAVAALAPDGAGRWELRAPGALVTASLGGEGLVFGGTERWVIYGLWTPAVARGVWPYHRGDRAGTGRAAGAVVGRSQQSQWGNAFDFVYLQERLSSPDSTERRRVLDELAVRIADADLAGSYHYTLYLLESIAGRAVSSLGSVRNASAADGQLRARAVDLLGVVGDRETVGFLGGLLAGEPEPSVRIAAARALSALATSRDAGEIGQAALGAIEADMRVSSEVRSMAFGRALLELLAGAVAQDGGGQPAVRQALVRIAGGAYGALVAREAAAFASGEQ